MADGRAGNLPTKIHKNDPAKVHNLILYTLSQTLVNAAFARVLWYNKGILSTGEIGVSDKNLLEKLRAEYEQKIAEMELRHKQEMDLLKEQLSSMRKLLFCKRQNIVCPNRQKKKQPEGCVTA